VSTKSALPAGAIVKVKKKKAEDENKPRPDPRQSLMPVKEKLRAETQRIARSGQAQQIQFYREQFRQRMKKIVEIAELSFYDADAARRLGNWHIAKPLTTAELSRLERYQGKGDKRNDRLELASSRPEMTSATDYDKLVPYI
jgi:hypothetical protein